MRILVVGAGATGGYFGGRLAQHDRDVTFLVHERRAEQLASDGLQIVSEHGDVNVRPKVTLAAGLDEKFDLILLSVKAYALDQAIADLAPAVGQNSLILPTLNGMKHIDHLVERFGRNRVLGGVCVVSTTLDERGRVLQLAPMQELTYGVLDGAEVPTDRLAAVDSVLQDAGFSARLTDGITAAMWRKWLMLASAGAMNVLAGGTIGEIIAAPGGLQLADDLIAEAVAVAAAAGHPLSESGRAWIATMMTTAGSNFTTSMFRDMQAGQPVEVDAIIGDLVHRGNSLAVATRLFQVALTNLTVYETRRAKAHR